MTAIIEFIQYQIMTLLASLMSFLGGFFGIFLPGGEAVPAAELIGPEGTTYQVTAVEDATGEPDWFADVSLSLEVTSKTADKVRFRIHGTCAPITVGGPLEQQTISSEWREAYLYMSPAVLECYDQDRLLNPDGPIGQAESWLVGMHDPRTVSFFNGRSPFPDNSNIVMPDNFFSVNVRVTAVPGSDDLRLTQGSSSMVLSVVNDTEVAQP
jgi:hypothetical protein